MNSKYELFSNIGIDSMSFYAPRYYLNLEKLAIERNIDPNKYKEGLLLKEMRLPEVNEDVISMGVKAGYYALLRGKIHPKDIDAVFVGTETMTYAVKSVSNIFAQLLGIPINSLTQDVYNACASGTLAILNGIALIEKEMIKKALIICVDTASYSIGSPSEATQGAGAIAIILSKNPRIAVFSNKFGKASGNINDFYRAPYEKNANVFGNYSINSYLEFQLQAYDDLMENQLKGEFYADHYAFHAPFSKMPLKIMQQIIEKRWINDINGLLSLQISEVVSNISRSVDVFLKNIFTKSFVIPEYFYLKLKEYGLSSDKLERLSCWIIDTIRNKIMPQLEVPMHFGNMYSASVWAQILYILENFVRKSSTIYFGSYGSGATCISGLLKVQPTFKDILVNGPKIQDFINSKVEVSVHEYEDWKNGKKIIPITFGLIDTPIENGNRGFILNYCDEGCIIPHLKGLDYCPKGHPGFHTRFFPLYAILKSDPISSNSSNMSFVKNSEYVRISPSAKKGNMLEYELRRVSPDIQQEWFGLLNWIPTYIPVINVY